MESFSTGSSHSSRASPRRRTKDLLTRTPASLSPPPSSRPHALPPSSERKFKLSFRHNDDPSLRPRMQSDALRDLSANRSEKARAPVKRAPGGDKFISVQSLHERSEGTVKMPVDSDRDSSPRPSQGKRNTADDHDSSGRMPEQSSKLVMKEEKDVGGIPVRNAHAERNKRNGPSGDDPYPKSEAESTSQREGLQRAKNAPRSSPVGDLSAQMDADRLSAKEKNAARLPLKKAFKTLRALNEVGNSRELTARVPSEHVSSSNGESLQARKRVSPSVECADGTKHKQAIVTVAECVTSIQDFPINFSLVSKKARSNRHRRSVERVAIEGEHQEACEGKQEEASKEEGFLASKARKNSNMGFQGGGGGAESSKGVTTYEEACTLEEKRTGESRDVALLVVKGESDAGYDGAKASDTVESTSANIPTEMEASIAFAEKTSWIASAMEGQEDEHRSMLKKDRMNLAIAFDDREREMGQDAKREKSGRTLLEVGSVDGTFDSCTAMELYEATREESLPFFLDKGPVIRAYHASPVTIIQKELNTSMQTTQAALLTVHAEAQGSSLKELPAIPDVQRERFLQRENDRLRACPVQDGGEKMDQDHQGHGKQPFSSGAFQLSVNNSGTCSVQALSHMSDVKAPVAPPARSFQPALQHTQFVPQNFSQAQAHTNNVSQPQARTASDGFTASFSQVRFHNPSHDFNGVSIDSPELSCGGISQWPQAYKHSSQSRQSASAKDHFGLVSELQEASMHRPGIPLYQWNVENGSFHGFPTGQVQSKVLDLGMRDLEGPARQAKKHTDFSGRSSHKDEMAIHVTGTRDTWSEALAERSLERVYQENPTRKCCFIEDGGGDQDVSGGKIGLHEIATEPVAVMARKMQEIPESVLDGLKLSAKDLLGSFERRDEFLNLQSTIKSRTDLTDHTLLHAQQTQLEILVAFKTGLQDFVQGGAKPLTYKVLTEIFLQTRCCNLACQHSLPVDGCECKVCSAKKGFCHECMCVVCAKFDSDNQTCRWVGCDICLHWCHTDCGLRKDCIAPAPSSQRSERGNTEMQYQCAACGHNSELFGFVKQVFHQFADNWSAETLTKELDCVRRIFHGSEDTRGKQLCQHVEKMLQKLESNVDTTQVQRSILQYFSHVDGNEGTTASKHSMCSEVNDALSVKAVVAHVDPTSRRMLDDDKAQVMLQLYESVPDRIDKIAVHQIGKTRKRAEIEGMVQMKEAEANMLQLRADEAHKEARGLQQIINLKQEKMEGDYLCEYAKLRLNAAEAKRSKRLLELQALEKAQREYERMKHRIKAQVQDLAMKMRDGKLALCLNGAIQVEN